MKSILLVIFLVLGKIVFAQVTISPIIGVEMNTFGGKVPENAYNYYYTTTWESKSLIFGVSASHPITKELDLEFSTCFTKNRENIRYRALIIYTYGIDYNIILNYLTLKKEFGKLVYVKVGLGLNSYFNIRNYFPKDSRSHGKIVQPSFFDFGIPMGIGIKKYGVVLNLSYFQGIFPHDTWKNGDVPPIQNFMIYLGYEINL